MKRGHSLRHREGEGQLTLFSRVGPRVSTLLSQARDMKSELGFIIPTSTSARRSPHSRCPDPLDLAQSKSTGATARRPQSRGAARPCPRQKADWWFNHMRQLVAEGREIDVPGVF